MSNITKIAKEEVNRLENELKKVNTFLEKAPKGCLKWQNKNGKTYYVNQVEREKDEIDKEVRDDINEEITEKDKRESK